MSGIRLIISGGGTGGHIFPAIAIARAVQKIQPDAEVLFVGAQHRMEMERVPAAGFKIVGLPIAGFQRGALLANLGLPFKILDSLWKARQTIKEFQPDVAVGVGGYASGPLLQMARLMGVPYLIQEQNSFAGITNKILSKGAAAICVAYPGMEKVFPANKIKLTGNPIRPEITTSRVGKAEALNYFGLSGDKPVVLLMGGSLGARTLNEAVKSALPEIRNAAYQLIWQTGKGYYPSCAPLAEGIDNIRCMQFVDRMDMAYAAADVMVSRAGALSIAEIQAVGKPCILVPSPNVAEDHQTHNALALTNAGAALMVKDDAAVKDLFNTVFLLLNDKSRCEAMSVALKKMAITDADQRIATLIIEQAQARQKKGR